MGASYDITPVRQRLSEYMASESLNNSRFEKRCGLYNGFVKDMDSQIKFESLAKIAEGCPNLNLGWLFSGLGHMLLADSQLDEKPTIEVSVVKTAGSVIISDASSLEAMIQSAVLKAVSNSNQSSQ